MDQSALTTAIKAESHRLGFDLVGVCPAVSPPRIDRFRQWLADGYAGQMHYLPNRADAYEHPRSVLDSVKSVVMLGMNYWAGQAAQSSENEGRVARYAWGERDYHDVIHDRLKLLCAFVRQHEPAAAVRGVVDTAPILERDFAQLAGLGWIGKNTLLLNKEKGSWLFLAALLLDVELECDKPFESDHCGSCRACLDVCPTDAFPQPYVLDATRCISYLTIELRQPIPNELRTGIGEWLFGCDLCQDVCPWNHRATESPVAEFAPDPLMNPADLAELFQLDDAAFRDRFRNTPLWRSKRRGILRNAAIVLGNGTPNESGRAALCKGLCDAEPLVRGACAWALGQSGDPCSRNALLARSATERDLDVRQEIKRAMNET